MWYRGKKHFQKLADIHNHHIFLYKISLTNNPAIMNRRLSVLSIFIIFSFTSVSQDQSSVKFGQVTASDFSLKNIKVDTTYGAVILSEIGNSYFDGNSDGWFTLMHQVKKRIYILNKKAFDLATVAVYLYHASNNDSEEKLENIKASTYNLVNGNVEEIKMSKGDVFREKMSANNIVKKFTMPAVKEGSIIEYSYTIKSDFLFNLQPWHFQGNYPKLWSEYKVQIPQIFDYITLSTGYLPYHLVDNKTKRCIYLLRERRSISALGPGTTSASSDRTETFTYESQDNIVRWVVKDAPVLKEENFTTSVNNHITKIEFQQSAVNIPGSETKNIMRSWPALSKDMMEDKDFGEEVIASNKWLDKNWLNNPETVSLENAKNIFHYVQRNIKCKGNSGKYKSQTFKETFQNKNGFTADVNLLLTMLLHKQGFNVNPVILSTRSHGMITASYPLIQQYNYVICKLTINDKVYYLDATSPNRSFNYLPTYCYNNGGRCINVETPSFEPLFADSISENKITNVLLMLDDKGSNWKGTLQSSYGNAEAEDIRETISEKGLAYFNKKISDAYPPDIKLNEIKFTNLDSTEKSLAIKYDLNIENNASDIIYFSPMLKEAITENYFKAPDRYYPVEMPFKLYETYMIKLFIPVGYTVDEIPKSERLNLDNNDGMFEYLVRKNEDDIDIRVILKLNKATFPVEDYETLRTFFDLVVKKEAEQIVFKKK